MKELLYLTQTDTTIGFVSQNRSKIDHAKRRLPNKHYICVVNSLSTLTSFTRIPTKHKNRIRRSKKSTFIMPNGNSFRVVKETQHNLLLDRIQWSYSSSANLSGAKYDEQYAKKMTEVIIGFSDKKNGEASKVYCINQSRLKVIR